MGSEYLDGFLGLSQTLFSQRLSEQSKLFGPRDLVNFLKEVKNSIVVGYCLSSFSAFSFYAPNKDQIMLGYPELMKSEGRTKDEFILLFN